MRLLIFTVLAVGVAALAGCAGTLLDTDFRSKIAETQTTLGGGYNSDTNAGTITIGETIYWREPVTSGSGGAPAKSGSASFKQVIPLDSK